MRRTGKGGNCRFNTTDENSPKFVFCFGENFHFTFPTTDQIARDQTCPSDEYLTEYSQVLRNFVRKCGRNARTDAIHLFSTPDGPVFFFFCLQVPPFPQRTPLKGKFHRFFSRGSLPSATPFVFPFREPHFRNPNLSCFSVSKVLPSSTTPFFCFSNASVSRVLSFSSIAP